jgi:hypothetical protein
MLGNLIVEASRDVRDAQADQPRRHVPLRQRPAHHDGALFGALYANVAPRTPLPSWARGPAAALGENFATWPLLALADRLHPARAELPAAFANPRALAQSTWRHLLFGVVLGELERRLNAPEEIETPDYLRTVSANGHGRLEHLAATS